MNNLEYLKNVYGERLIEKINGHRRFCSHNTCKEDLKAAVDHMFDEHMKNKDSIASSFTDIFEDLFGSKK